MKVLESKGTRIGEGRPKAIVSLMGSTLAECVSVARRACDAGANLLEWRSDFSQDLHDTAALALQSAELAHALPHHPLLFTFRSVSQGGNGTLPVDEYVALNKAVIAAGAVDLIDVEAWIGNEAVRDLVDCAHEQGILAVVSHHDFGGTPAVDELVDLLVHLAELGADIPKVATMATSVSDALSLMEATNRVREHIDAPLLTMAMGEAGSLTRLAGEFFGSALTFCALDTASAPGQVEVTQAVRIMDELHTACPAC